MFKLRLTVLVCLLLPWPNSASATDYYVSTLGNDGHNGTSAATPWQTVARVNAVVLQPGDRVLLRGGDQFTGGLEFDSLDTGTAAAPIAVGSYGTGRATIRPPSGAGISAYNASGYRISNLTVIGAGDWASGIMFFADLPGAVKLPFIRIDAVDVSGFGRDGIEIGSWNGATGFRDVRITNVSAHANARTGIFVFAQAPNTHESVYVGYSRAFGNPGIPGATTNSGSGIVLGGVNGGTVERSVAYGNGHLCTASEGPVGIWTYDSTRVVIQHNESLNNRSSGPADGGGFDLDQNVSYSVVQYNYSHGNDGAGYLIAHAPANDAHRGNVIRYNISENDGRRNSYGAIEVWGRTVDTDIYNNTVFLSPSASGTPRAVRIWNASIPDRLVVGLRLRNNILQTSAGLTLVDVSPSQITGTRFEGNAYFSSGAAFRIVWSGATYSSLSAWRATTQETAAGVSTGTSADPMLEAPGGGGTIGDAARLESVTAYRLREGSPAVDAGRDTGTSASIPAATRDYFGNQVPQGVSLDIGAHETTPVAGGAEEIVLYATTAPRVSGGWRKVADSSAAGGTRLWHPNAGAAKLTAALAAPVHFFDLTFTAEAGRAYRLWLRGVAESNHWSNDSVFVQFSNAVTDAGSPVWRIGTTAASSVNLEDCGGCGVSGWGWQDNGYGVLGPLVYFAADGPQTIRIQTREDGFSIDQIVLSSSAYLTRAPGSLRNDATILPAGTAGGGTPPAAAREIVIYAADVNAIAGDWTVVADSTAAAGKALWNPNRSAAKVTAAKASPASYFDVSFDVQAGVAYHVWLRMRAEGNHYSNDSVYMQLTGATDASGTPIYRIGTTSGAAVSLQDFEGAPISAWGWNDPGWATLAAPVYFDRSGRQTLRIQQREDGVSIDQIVISAQRHLALSPGALTNDTTILVK